MASAPASMQAEARRPKRLPRKSKFFRLVWLGGGAWVLLPLWVLLSLFALVLDPSNAGIWLFLGLGLAVFLVLAWGIWRTTHPSVLNIALAVQPETLRRGDRVDVTLGAGGTLDKAVQVGVVCTEISYYIDARFREMVRHVPVWESWHDARPGAAGDQRFSIEIPADAPYSYEGRCLTFDWRGEARRPSRLRFDRRRTASIWILP